MKCPPTDVFFFGGGEGVTKIFFFHVTIFQLELGLYRVCAVISLQLKKQDCFNRVRILTCSKDSTAKCNDSFTPAMDRC